MVGASSRRDQGVRVTIREIAETAGCNPETVRRITASRMPGKMVKGKVTRFTWDEAHQLMAMLPRTNSVDLPQPPTTGVVGQPDRLDRLEAIVEKLVGAVATLAAQIPTRSNVSALPAPQPQLVPEIPVRKQIVNVVNDYAVKFEDGQFEHVWRRLYKEFGDRYGMDVKARASHKGIKPIEYLEREGLLEPLYLVAIAVLGKGAA